MKNRELKFRIWLGDKFKVVPLELAGRCYHSPCMHYNYDTFGVFEHVQSENRIYQQYTGLKDKNGKEIYEGDIVIHLNISKNALEKFYVEFWDGGFYLTHVKRIYGGLRLNSEKSEIIGNIFENPELIK